MRGHDSTAREGVSRRGRYCDQLTHWFDETQQQWFPASGEQENLEIDLEDVGARSRTASLLTTLVSQNGSTLMRFVGRVRTEDGRTYSVGGPMFSRPRSIPDDLAPDEAWCPGMNGSLEELRHHLSEDGWVAAGHGEQPWAYRYRRPVVDWRHPQEHHDEAARFGAGSRR
ncbi:MAG: hypothetical protein ACLGIA_03150 [Actinomycetes bacterium]